MKSNEGWACVLLAAFLAVTVHAQATDKWRFDVSLYGVAAGMSGNATVKGINAEPGGVPSKPVTVGFIRTMCRAAEGASFVTTS